MWLLSTDRAELHYFNSPTSVLGGFAILSHTWRDKEQSFQDVQRIIEQCKEQGLNLRNHVDSKIRECCKLAESHGFRWAWVDSCCIDKTSSTELSEAINSMFDWYAQSEVCYVLLEDVPSDCVLHAPGSAFREARWHTRGWTLQELIAPSIVLFMSKDWKLLGTKSDPSLAQLLEEITQIPSEVLTREAYFFSYDIAVRMRWASRRRTTRVEDEAYSLMGIFQVKIPVMYGEGRYAFQRLQEEILKKSEDTSLFAWWIGTTVSPDSLSSQGLTLDAPLPLDTEQKYLFAPSPQWFTNLVFYTPFISQPLEEYPPRQADADDAISAGPFGEVKLPTFSTTSYGIRCEFPVFDAGEITIAVLLCETHDSHLGLILHRDGESLDPSRPRYFTGYSVTRSARTQTYRIVKLGRNLRELRFNGKVYKAQWRTIYIVPRPPDKLWLLSTLSSLGWDGVYEEKQGLRSKSIKLPNRNCGGWICIDLGLCETDGCHWARVRTPPGATYTPPPPHDCKEDHVNSNSWFQLTKEFGDAERRVRLSLMRCRMNPESTYVIHLELFGTVFESILRDARITIPTREQLNSTSPASDSSSTSTSPLGRGTKLILSQVRSLWRWKLWQGT